MSLSRQQRKLMDALEQEGKGSCLYLSGVLTSKHGYRWSSETVKKVMKQLKYRALVEYTDSVWKPVSQ